MTPKEEAKNLFTKYWDLCADESIDCLTSRPKKMALIAIDKILEVVNILSSTDSQHDYWQQVRKEIEKL